MTDLRFEHDAPVTDGPDLDDQTCHCPNADDQYLPTIEDGQAVLIHAACGKTPPSAWGDWHDLVVMDQPIPVTVEWTPNCDGSMWHGDQRCDCGAYVQVTASADGAGPTCSQCPTPVQPGTVYCSTACRNLDDRHDDGSIDNVYSASELHEMDQADEAQLDADDDRHDDTAGDHA